MCKIIFQEFLCTFSFCLLMRSKHTFLSILLFLFLFLFMLQHGSVYKLAFGPKAFVVVSDPIVARYILRENAFGYDKVIY